MFTQYLSVGAVLAAISVAAAPHSLEDRAGAAIGGGKILAGGPISNITVQASNVVQCQSATIRWTGAVEPVMLYIAIGGLYVGETPVATIPGLSGGSTTWQVDQASGQTLEFRVTDATNQVAYQQNIKIQPGDTSCLAAASSQASSQYAAPSSQWTEASATWSPDADAAAATASPSQYVAPTTAYVTTSPATLITSFPTSSRTSTTTSSSSTGVAGTALGAGVSASATRSSASRNGAVGAPVVAAALGAVIFALSATF